MSGYDGEGEPSFGKSAGERQPRILLMGMRRSGKSSIFKVVFHKMSPHETLFLDSTTKIVKNDVANSSFLHFQIWDFPGHIDVDDPGFEAQAVFGGAGAVVFVIDAQDEYSDALVKLQKTIACAHKVNPRIYFEVFIHKVDGLSDDHKMEYQRDVHQRVTDELGDDEGLADAQVAFYLSSIYDHSIYENMSKVVQKLIPQLPTLESLLDILISNCRVEKAFLFDVVSKVYIATDSSPVDVQSYELCSDMIDVVIDVSCIYGMREEGEGLAYDVESASVIRLNNGHALYLREVSKYLALVCLMRDDNLEKQGLIEYNVQCFKTALNDVFASSRRGGKAK